MTVYERLQIMKNNFDNAMETSDSCLFRKLWFDRSKEVQKKMDELTIEEANQTYNKKYVVTRLIGAMA